MRFYQPIWEQLKKEGTASVVANARLHPRILKAVVKEKWLDTAYKLVTFPYKSRIEHSVSANKITFRLTTDLRPSSTVSEGDL